MTTALDYSRGQRLALQMGRTLIRWAQKQAERTAARGASAAERREHRSQLCRRADEQREAAILMYLNRR